MSDPRDLLQRIARVGAEIDPALTDRDVERLVTGARARARRRRLARGVLIVAAGGIATMIAFALRPIDGARAHAPTLATVPARTEQSDALSKDLQKRGFRFVGTTIIYAFMQATGLVNDHLVACPRWAAVQTDRGR